MKPSPRFTAISDYEKANSLTGIEGPKEISEIYVMGFEKV